MEKRKCEKNAFFSAGKLRTTAKFPDSVPCSSPFSFCSLAGDQRFQREIKFFFTRMEVATAAASSSISFNCAGLVGRGVLKVTSHSPNARIDLLTRKTKRKTKRNASHKTLFRERALTCRCRTRLFEKTNRQLDATLRYIATRHRSLIDGSLLRKRVQLSRFQPTDRHKGRETIGPSERKAPVSFFSAQFRGIPIQSILFKH